MEKKVVYRVSISCSPASVTMCVHKVTVPRGYKYRDLALQVGGISRIGTIKYGFESRETQT
jgi:hypothetical protein